MTARRHYLGLALASLALTGALAVYGALVHPIELAGGTEQDDYVGRAEMALRGDLPCDPFRPLLYPLLVAALATQGPEPFAAARLISNFAAAGLAAVAWGLARRFGGAAAGWVAFALVAAHPWLWTHGQTATTDPLYSALGALAWLAGLAWTERPDPRLALLAGAALGLAAFTRITALFLVPPLLALPLLARAAPRRLRLRHAALAAAAAAGCTLPHFGLRALSCGGPLRDESWKNLAFKLYGGGDWGYLARVPFDGAVAVVAADPGRFLAGGLAELAQFVARGAGALLGLPLLAALALAGFLLALRRRPAPALWLSAAAAVYLAAVAFSFFLWQRFLLILLPVAMAFAAIPFGAAASALAARRVPLPSRRPLFLPRAVPALLAALVVGLLAVRGLQEPVPAFAAAHPVEEARALRELGRTLPSDAVIAASMAFFARQVPGHRLVETPQPIGAELEEPDLYFERLRAFCARERVGWLVVGRVALGARPQGLLGVRPPVPWLLPAGGDAAARVWRVVIRDADSGQESAGAAAE